MPIPSSALGILPMAAFASTQTWEVGEGNREFGKMGKDAGGGGFVLLLSPLVKFSRLLNTYPKPSSTFPHSGFESIEK